MTFGKVYIFVSDCFYQIKVVSISLKHGLVRDIPAGHQVGSKPALEPARVRIGSGS